MGFGCGAGNQQYSTLYLCAAHVDNPSDDWRALAEERKMGEPVPFAPVRFFSTGHGLNSRRERRQERLQNFLVRLLARSDDRQKAAQRFELLLHQPDLNPT